MNSGVMTTDLVVEPNSMKRRRERQQIYTYTYTIYIVLYTNKCHDSWPVREKTDFDIFVKICLFHRMEIGVFFKGF